MTPLTTTVFADVVVAVPIFVVVFSLALTAIEYPLSAVELPPFSFKVMVT